MSKRLFVFRGLSVLLVLSTMWMISVDDGPERIRAVPFILLAAFAWDDAEKGK